MAAALKSARWNDGYRWTAYLQIAILLVCIISLPLWKENEVQEDEKEAQKKIHSMDKKRDSYFGYYAGQDWKACHTYDLSISTSSLGIDKAVDLICQYIDIKFK